MHFTIEDYNKIEQWLRRNSVKDTEFPEVICIQNGDTIPIIQNGNNKRLDVSKLIQYLNVEVGNVLTNGDEDYSVVSLSDIGPNTATGKGSIAFGLGTKTNIPYSVVFGKFNYLPTTIDTLFNFGIGTSDANRVNAISLHESGQLFIKGIGNYDGTSTSQAKCLQDVVSDIETNYDTIADTITDVSVVVKGEVENSAVLKGEYNRYSNKAISKTSMAVGAGTIAGLKGWYYSNIDFTNKKITLSDKQVVNRFGVLSAGSWSLETLNIRRGDIISLVNDSKFDFCSKVTAIDGNVITVDSLPFTSIASNGIFNNLDDNSVYIPDRPDAGIIDFGGGALAEGGLGSKASNICAHAEGLTTHAYGQYSHAEGRETKAAYAAHAEGKSTTASGAMSHAEGSGTTASGWQSHAEGKDTIASGNISHAEGQETKATNNCAHAEGVSTEATGIGSHSEGSNTKATTWQAHAEGNRTEASGNASHSEGYQTIAQGNHSHAEGYGTVASGIGSHAEGGYYISDENKSVGGNASGVGSHAEGCLSEASGIISHAEGYNTKANGENSHAEGCETKATGVSSHAEGGYNIAEGQYSHAEGANTKALNSYTHTEGYSTIAKKWASHAEGYGSSAIGSYSHSEGNNTIANGESSHSEGMSGKSYELLELNDNQTYVDLWVENKDFAMAFGNQTHIEGVNCFAGGNHSHAEGNQTFAKGWQSHSEGHSTQALGNKSHAEGWGTIANNDCEHACGKYNNSTKSSNAASATAFSVGGGTSNTARSNLFEIKQNGDVYIKGFNKSLQQILEELGVNS